MAGNDRTPESPALPWGFLREGEEAAHRLYLRPLGRPHGGYFRFSRCEVLWRTASGTRIAVAGVDELRAWAWSEGEDVGVRVSTLLDRCAAARPPFAGIALDHPLLLGVVNVTPDSFSDGGRFLDPGAAVTQGLALRDAGADLIDVGGESTRPGAAAVPVAEELRRVVPVVRDLVRQGARVSVDTRRAAVMAAALDAGAVVVNDITALAGDCDALDLVAGRRVPAILMHMQGEPATMQADPRYEDAVLDVFDHLAGRVAACEERGMAPAMLAVDPGIGFGKTVAHNLEILGRLSLYLGLGCVVAVGASRKSFIARLSAEEPADRRLAGSLAAALWAVQAGAHILRVHDVAETRQALRIWQAISGAAQEL